MDKQEDDKEQFQLLVESLIDYYNPISAPEVADIVTMSRLLWLKRKHPELNSDERRFDQEMSRALRRLTTSKALHRISEMQRTQRRKQQLGLIRLPRGAQAETPPRHLREMLRALEPPIGGPGVTNGFDPADSQDAEECRRQARQDALYVKLTEGKITPEEELELNALFERDPVRHPARIEDHPMYEAAQAWGRAAEEGKQAPLRQRR